MRIALILGLTVVGGLAGCQPATNSASSSAVPATPGTKTELTIISPHSQDIQDEFTTAWKKVHPEITLKWFDQGGSSDDLNWVLAEFKRKPAGIGMDVFFGGGPESFIEMENRHLLQRLTSTYGIPAQLNGVPLRGHGNTWVGAALSGFGMLYNKTLLARDHIKPPATWADLATPAFHDRLALADPRHSGSAHAAYEIILQTNGWHEGWRILTGMAANARSFQDSSSALLQQVTSGEAPVTLAIDFYARSTIARAGANKLGYVEPAGQRVVTADPIGILQGAPNLPAARLFVDFVMSPTAQNLWMRRQGTRGGPVSNDLLRLAALPQVYRGLPADPLIGANPYEQKNTRPYDADKAARRRILLDDLVGAALVDNLHALQQAPASPGHPLNLELISESDADKLAAQWKDPAMRSRYQMQWQQAARQRLGS